MAPLEVIIIGGGLAGSCLANGLVNKSDGLIQVTVYEREEASSKRGGYQIRLGSHALTGFKACLTDEQYSSLLLLFGRSGGVVSSAPCIFRPADLEVLLDLSQAPLYEKSAPIGRAVLRDCLVSCLMESSSVDGRSRGLSCYESAKPQVLPSKLRPTTSCLFTPTWLKLYPPWARILHMEQAGLLSDVKRPLLNGHS